MLFRLSSRLGLLFAALLQVQLVNATVKEARSWEPHADPYGNDLGVEQSVISGPAGDLKALSHTGYATLKHAAFPRYGVRVKKSKFCDETVDAYTGYIDVEAKHLFFYFFESRRDPDTDDVVFWTNGGPGSSSSIGLFMELGPCRVNGPSNTTSHPQSWNEVSNIFFLDQPVGVGFSYAEHGEYVSTTEEAAKDIAAFVAIFFHHFEKFKNRGFHLSGESYAGRYIPVYAAEIYEQNKKLISEGIAPINVTSVLIGNGCTDWATVFPSYYEISCMNISAPPVFPISTCVDFKRRNQRCETWYQKECVERTDPINCKAAFEYCVGLAWGLYGEAGVNVYDITKPCIGELCYAIADDILKYLNIPEVQKQIGVDPAASNFTLNSRAVHEAILGSNDQVFPTQYYLSALLERGIRVLLFVGANDFACNWVGIDRMARALEWTGQEQFVAKPLEEWVVDDHPAGLVRAHKGFTFATVYDAGHMAPYDKPVESLELLKRWLYDGRL